MTQTKLGGPGSSHRDPGSSVRGLCDVSGLLGASDGVNPLGGSRDASRRPVEGSQAFGLSEHGVSFLQGSAGEE